MILKLYLELNNHLKCLKVLMIIKTISTSLADITLGKPQENHYFIILE